MKCFGTSSIAPTYFQSTGTSNRCSGVVAAGGMSGHVPGFTEDSLASNCDFIDDHNVKSEVSSISPSHSPPCADLNESKQSDFSTVTSHQKTLVQKVQQKVALLSLSFEGGL